MLVTIVHTKFDEENRFKRLGHVLSDKRQIVESVSLVILLSAHLVTNYETTYRHVIH